MTELFDNEACSFIHHILDDNYFVGDDDVYDLPEYVPLSWSSQPVSSKGDSNLKAEAKFLSILIANKPFVKVTTRDDWRNATNKYVLLFDDATLTPNSRWEHVIESNAVQKVRRLILNWFDPLVEVLLSNMLFVLRDTEHHRQQALENDFKIKSVTKMYRFSSSEIKAAFRRHADGATGVVRVIPWDYPKGQLIEWRNLCKRHGFRNAKAKFPDDPADMYVVLNCGRTLGAVFVIKESSKIHVFLTDNLGNFWSLFYELVKKKLFDDDYCFKVCLGLLHPKLREQVLAEGGTFLHSVSLGCFDPVEVIDLE